MTDAAALFKYDPIDLANALRDTAQTSSTKQQPLSNE